MKSNILVELLTLKLVLNSLYADLGRASVNTHPTIQYYTPCENISTTIINKNFLKLSTFFKEVHRWGVVILNQVKLIFIQQNSWNISDLDTGTTRIILRTFWIKNLFKSCEFYENYWGTYIPRPGPFFQMLKIFSVLCDLSDFYSHYCITPKLWVFNMSVRL